MNLPLDALTSPSGVAGDRAPSLREAAAGFEAVLARALLRALRATVPSGGLLDSSGARQTYEYLFDSVIAEAVAARGSLGIARLMRERLAARDDVAKTAQARGAFADIHE